MLHYSIWSGREWRLLSSWSRRIHLSAESGVGWVKSSRRLTRWKRRISLRRSRRNRWIRSGWNNGIRRKRESMAWWQGVWHADWRSYTNVRRQHNGSRNTHSIINVTSCSRDFHFRLHGVQPLIESTSNRWFARSSGLNCWLDFGCCWSSIQSLR